MVKRELNTGGADTAGPVVARLKQPTSEQPIRIAVVADPHLSPSRSGTWKVYHRTEERFRTLIADIDDRDVDHTVFVGDLTADGEAEEFEQFERLIEPLRTPWTALPGNHDVSKAFDDIVSPSVAEFAERYGPPGETYPSRLTIGGVDAVLLHSATMPDRSLRNTWGGAISDKQIAWLGRELPRTTAPIVFSHHNLFELPEHPPEPPWSNFSIRNSESVIEVLAEHDVPLFLSGHQHLPAVTVRDEIREIVTPAVGSFPQAYLLVDVGPEGTVARLVPLATREETQEAYWHMVHGDETARGLVPLLETRLPNMPLLDEW